MKVLKIVQATIIALLHISYVTYSYGLIVYGESNDDAGVDYTTANVAEKSVVNLGGNSGVYLGNGWFITANHCYVKQNSTKISQNGHSTDVIEINNVLNQEFGVDLKLVRADTTELESFTNLCAAKLDTRIYSELKNTLLKEDGSVAEYGSELIFVGNGYGRLGDDLYATTVKKDKTQAIRSGISTCFEYDGILEDGRTKCIACFAENKVGVASAVERDSGSAMFYSNGSEFFLVGTIVGATNADTVWFNELTKQNIENENTISVTLAVNLEAYLSTISRITGVTIPESSNYGILFALFSFLIVPYLKYRRQKNKNLYQI